MVGKTEAIVTYKNLQKSLGLFVRTECGDMIIHHSINNTYRKLLSSLNECNLIRRDISSLINKIDRTDPIGRDMILELLRSQAKLLPPMSPKELKQIAVNMILQVKPLVNGLPVKVIKIWDIPLSMKSLIGKGDQLCLQTVKELVTRNQPLLENKET